MEVKVWNYLEEYKKENKRKKERVEAFNKQEGRKTEQFIQEKIMEARRRQEEMARRGRGAVNMDGKISNRVRELKNQKSKKGKK